MAYNPKKKYDIENQVLQTLSQKWSAKDKNIADYACNSYADQIAALDKLIEQAEKENLDTQELEQVRSSLMVLGTAHFIKHSDILTQLGIRVGRTGVREFNARNDDE